MKPYPMLLGMLLLTSCYGPHFEYTAYYPVLITRESLERSVALLPAQPVENAAKIIAKGNFLFTLERYKGVLVIDNANPQSPVKKGYISIPGCSDMVIKENTMYVDNAVDLVAIDLSNISANSISVTKRIKKYFPEIPPPDGDAVPEKYDEKNRPANTVLIAWEK